MFPLSTLLRLTVPPEPPELRQYAKGDRVTVADLTRGRTWDGIVLEHKRGANELIVEDANGLTWRVGVGFVSARL